MWSELFDLFNTSESSNPKPPQHPWVEEFLPLASALYSDEIETMGSHLKELTRLYAEATINKEFHRYLDTATLMSVLFYLFEHDRKEDPEKYHDHSETIRCAQQSLMAYQEMVHNVERSVKMEVLDDADLGSIRLGNGKVIIPTHLRKGGPYHLFSFRQDDQKMSLSPLTEYGLPTREKAIERYFTGNLLETRVLMSGTESLPLEETVYGLFAHRYAAEVRNNG